MGRKQCKPQVSASWKLSKNQDKIFQLSCQEVNIPATKRQERRWNRKEGLAYKTAFGK